MSGPQRGDNDEQVLDHVHGLRPYGRCSGDGRGETSPIRIERTVEGSYAPPYVAPVTGCKSLLGPWACLIIETRPSEAFFTAEVTDAHGQPVFVSVISDYRTIATFCGETTRPIAFNPGSGVEFRIGIDWPGQLECPANRVKTIGTISVTLSNMP